MANSSPDLKPSQMAPRSALEILHRTVRKVADSTIMELAEQIDLPFNTYSTPPRDRARAGEIQLAIRMSNSVEAVQTRMQLSQFEHSLGDLDPLENKLVTLRRNMVLADIPGVESTEAAKLGYVALTVYRTEVTDIYWEEAVAQNRRIVVHLRGRNKLPQDIRSQFPNQLPSQAF